MTLRAIPLLLLLSCGANTSILIERSECDGVQQRAEEDGIDSLFDRDGDGFFDGGNPGCLETYTADQLDCDDTRADVRPDADEVLCNSRDDDCDPSTIDSIDADEDGIDVCDDCDDDDPDISPLEVEICGDEIDNNCDGETDNDCDEINLSGIYDLQSPVTWRCNHTAFGVQMNMVGLDVSLAEPLIRITSTGSEHPGRMEGDYVDGTFFVERVIDGACRRTFTMQGIFDIDARTVTGDLDIGFSGTLCPPCQGQSFNFTAALP